MPAIEDTRQFRFKVDAGQLAKLRNPAFERPREPAIYQAPLVIVKEAPGVTRRDGMAWLATENVTLPSQSFHAASGSGHRNGIAFIRYLQLLTHSELWVRCALLTSLQFGAERRRTLKEDLDGFPIVPWENLTEEQQVKAGKLSDRLLAGDSSVFGDIDAFFAGLCGLDPRDMEVIRDTLSMGLPFKMVRAKASRPPERSGTEILCTTGGGIAPIL